MPGKTRCFESIRSLQNLNPIVFRSVLCKFSDYLRGKGLELTEDQAEGALDYEAIKRILLGGDLPSGLDDVLFFVGRLGDSRGQEQLEKEAKLRGRTLNFNRQGLSCCDFAMMVWLHEWPKNCGLLEAAYARSRIFAKSAYVYYPMSCDFRSQFRLPTDEKLKQASERLNHYFANQEGLGKGTNLVQYEFETEIWFLVRYPGRVKRHREFDDQGQADTHTFRPEEYDAVVYHKEYGDLRLNTNRGREYTEYRITFGHLLFDQANVFDPNAKIVRLDPLMGECLGIFNCNDIERLQLIEPVEVCFSNLSQSGVRVIWKADGDSSLLEHGRLGKRLLPEGAHSIDYARFRYRLRDRMKWERMTVHKGQALRYERDGDSSIVEEWLRRRKFIKNPIELK